MTYLRPTQAKLLYPIIALIISLTINAQQLAFPSAMGAGAYTTGGRGGKVCIVNTVEWNPPGSYTYDAITDSYSGSFYELFFELDIPAKYIVFAVSGNIIVPNYTIIDFKNKTHKGNITIAGQTAPGKINFSTDYFQIYNLQNTIWRFCSFTKRQQDNGGVSNDDALNIRSESAGSSYTEYMTNLVFDHCSFFYGQDEGFSIYGDTPISEVTVQYCFLGGNVKGSILGCQQEADNSVSIKGNSYLNSAFVDSGYRFPNTVTRGDMQLDAVNIYVENPTNRLNALTGSGKMNITNYYVRYGNRQYAKHRLQYSNSGPARLWSANNEIIRTAGNLAPISPDYNYEDGVWSIFAASDLPTHSALPDNVKEPAEFPFLGANVEKIPTSQLYDEVLVTSGNTLRLDENGNVIEDEYALDTFYKGLASDPNISTVDYRFPSTFAEKYPTPTSGTPYTDTDKDGMPDAWETSNGLDPNVSNPNGFDLDPIYTNLEVFLNAIDGPIAPVQEPSITLIGDNPVNILQNSGVYIDAGATAFDQQDGDITENIIVGGDIVDHTIVGSYVITYDVTDSDSNTATQVTRTVNVNPLVNVTSVNVTPDTVTTNINQTYALTVEVLPTNATDVTGIWSSSDADIATVDEDGVITALAEGVVDITFTSSDGGFADISTVTVEAELLPLAPILVDAVLNGNDYILTFELDTNSLEPQGGFDTVINGEDQNDNASAGNYTRIISGLDTSVDQTFQIEARFTQFEEGEIPNRFPRSNEITVFSEAFTANAGPDQSICQGESATLSASGGTTYLWSTGETTQTISVDPVSTSTYSVTVISGSQQDIDEVTVFVDSIPELTVSEDVSIVEGDSIELSATGANTYLWSTGETTSSITVSPLETTTYNVLGTNGVCEVSENVTVTVEPLLNVDLGDDMQICEGSGENIILDAGNGDTYLWNTGETTQTISVDPVSTSTYSVTVTSGTQEDTDSITIFVDPNPNVVILNGDSVDILNGDFVTLSATGANTYEWNNGATQPNIAVSPAQTTVYEVRGYINECYDEKQVVVNVIPEVEADAGDDVEICLGETVLLTATGGDEYAWSNGEITQSIEVSPTETTEYTVTVFNALDFDEDSVIVNVISDCEESIEEPDPTINSDEPFEFTFDVFPNPTSDYVDVRIAGIENLARIYIYDMMGKLIYQKRVQNGSANVSSISRFDMSKLVPGMYYIQFQNLEKTMAKKLLVQ